MEGNLIFRVVKKTVEIIIIALFCAIIFFTAAQVLTRYLHISPFPWTEEIARLLLVWAVYLTVSVIVANRDHIFIDFFFRKLPERGKQFNILLSDCLFLIFSFVALFFGWIVSDAAMTDLSTSLRYPRAMFYIPIALSGALNLFFLTPILIDDVRKIGRSKGGSRR